MKRFHVHAHVLDLAQSIDFYTRLFGAAPARVEADYAKWMLDDPRLNFAISARGGTPGIDHLGFQAEDAEQLAAMKAQARDADAAMLDEGRTTCCYARSDKHWVTDPQGIAWEQFQTLDGIPVFREGTLASTAAAGTAPAAACCAPAAAPRVEQPVAAAACCGPQSSTPAAADGPSAARAAGRCC